MKTVSPPRADAMRAGDAAERRTGSWHSVSKSSADVTGGANAGNVMKPRTAHSQPMGGIFWGIGALADVGTAAAVANVVFHAPGRRLRELPITIDPLIVGGA